MSPQPATRQARRTAIAARLEGVARDPRQRSPGPWRLVTKFDRRACLLADRHYSRRKVGSPQFMPPGQTFVLLSVEGDAVWGWHRPHPASGVRRMDGLDGWNCSIFRNEGPARSSDLVLAAEAFLRLTGVDCGPDGLFTYVEAAKIKSSNPGWCYQCAGWAKRGLSADGKKRLLFKRWSLAGIAP